MKFRPKIEKIFKKNKKMSSPHNFVDFDDENHNIHHVMPKFHIKMMPNAQSHDDVTQHICLNSKFPATPRGWFIIKSSSSNSLFILQTSGNL